MRKLYIVKTTRDFDDIIKNGTCKKNKYFIVHYKSNNLKYDRFGISVSKKLGNAVFRNKYKRIIRSIIDIYKKRNNNQKDYIIIMRKESIDKSFNMLETELFSLLKSDRKEQFYEEK